MPPQQPPQEMLIDPPQRAHAHLSAKLMEHPRRWQFAPQAGELSPGGLFGQLCDQQIERMGGRQTRQQMHTPQLRRAQTVTSSAGESAGTQPGDKIIGHIVGELFEQRDGADGR